MTTTTTCVSPLDAVVEMYTGIPNRYTSPALIYIIKYTIHLYGNARNNDIYIYIYYSLRYTVRREDVDGICLTHITIYDIIILFRFYYFCTRGIYYFVCVLTFILRNSAPQEFTQTYTARAST